MTTRPNSEMLRTEWEACLLEPRRDPEMEAFARREMGVVPLDLPYLIPCPWVARAAVIFNQRLAVHLNPQLADTIALVVSHENSCRYCYATVRVLLRVQGMSEERVQELEGQLGGADGDPRVAAVTRFARRMARSAPLVGASDRQHVERAGFSPAEFLEIAFVVAQMVFGNRVTTIPAIPPYRLEQAPRSWRFRFLRPLYARALAPFSALASRTVPPPAPAYFARVINVYQGSPIGSMLARIITDAWTSPILSRRAKALMCAVIAKGLGCPIALAAAHDMLAEAGVERATSSRALDHLNAPELGDTDNLLLGFARDTLWYQPAVIQRRARTIRDRLTPAEFVEAVGVCAVANALGRLGAAVGES